MSDSVSQPIPHESCLTGRGPARSLLSLDLVELEQLMSDLGQPRFRARQVFNWVHGKGVLCPEEMRNLPTSLRYALERLDLAVPLSLEEAVQGADGTEKFRFRLRDGGSIESVLIPDEKRLTLCLSTQLGCRMGCTFCRTGKMGLLRNLTTAEILGQVHRIRFSRVPAKPLSHIVLMGMGEPLDNLENTVRVLKALTHPLGGAFSTRRVTVSTVGIPAALEQLFLEIPVSLTLSLNAPNSKVRDRIMPINRRYPLEKVLPVLREIPLPPRRRITIAYVLIRDLNDRPGDARELCRLLHGLRCKVNLIPLNPFPGLGLESPDESATLGFQALLRSKGISARVRFSRGSDILAACGQLASVPAGCGV